MRRDYLVIDKLGLHARPATLIVQEASKHENDIKIIYGEKSVNAKSVMSVMTLAITCDSTFAVEVAGDSPENVFNSIEKILTDNRII